MIKINLFGNYCLIEPQGPLTKDDFAAIAGQIDPIIDNQGPLDGLIVKTREFPGWEGLGDVIAHFRFVKNHHRSIKKIALVTDAKIAEIFPVIVDHFVKAEVKHFNFDDFDEAVAWID
jgi:hypothetical protein